MNDRLTLLVNGEQAEDRLQTQIDNLLEKNKKVSKKVDKTATELRFETSKQVKKAIQETQTAKNYVLEKLTKRFTKDLTKTSQKLWEETNNVVSQEHEQLKKTIERRTSKIDLNLRAKLKKLDTKIEN